MSTSIKVEVGGLDALIKQLANLGEAADDIMLNTVTDLTLDTHQMAVDGIQRGPATGAVYRKYNPSRTHRASAPGQYPMSDTGRLASNVKFKLPTETALTGEVGTTIMYGAHLEFGTSRMKPRPWLTPSFEKAKAGVEKELKAKLEGRI